MIEGAPLGLEEVDVEVEVVVAHRRDHVVDQAHLDVFDGVRKRAIITVSANANLVLEKVTELSFVLVFVVKTFDSVVGPSALVALRTAIGLSEAAQFRCEHVVVASVVFH